MLSVALSLLLIASSVESFQFKLNYDILRNRSVNLDLSIELVLQSYNVGSSNEIEACQLCVVKNGIICHCYSDRLSALQPYLTEECVDTEKNYWFSLMLQCNDVVSSSIGIYVTANDAEQNQHENQVTLVIPSTFQDMQRLLILLRSLMVIDNDVIYECLLIVPTVDVLIMRAAVLGFQSFLKFKIHVLDEATLIPPPKSVQEYYPYAIQMAVKLVVAKMVKTRHYITLDSDVVLLHNFGIDDIIRGGKAVYHNEPRGKYHPEWWDKSEAFLGFSKSHLAEQQGFGVTPAVLSTFGSLVLLNNLRSKYGTENFIEPWISSFGVSEIWSEYTLYRLVLDKLMIFDLLHYPEDNKILLCNPVWYEKQLPWNAADAFANSQCLFSLVQSSAGVSPMYVYRIIEELFSSSSPQQQQ